MRLDGDLLTTPECPCTGVEGTGGATIALCAACGDEAERGLAMLTRANPCGCKIVYKHAQATPSPAPVIDYCAVHYAAPDMREILNNLVQQLDGIALVVRARALLAGLTL